MKKKERGNAFKNWKKRKEEPENALKKLKKKRKQEPENAF